MKKAAPSVGSRNRPAPPMMVMAAISPENPTCSVSAETMYLRNANSAPRHTFGYQRGAGP